MNRQRFNRTLSFILISTLFVSVLPHQVRAETSSSEIASENPTENLSITQVSHNEDSNNVFNETQKEASATIEDHPTPENFFGKRIWDSFGLHDEKKTIENTTEEQGMSEEDNIDRNLPVSNPVYTDYIFGKNTNDKKQDIKGIEGKYTTSLFTGAATYTYPVEIPTGRNSFMPSVSLFYNSQNTRNDGVVGYGWDIGESYIERSDSKGVNIMYDLNEFKVVINSNQSDIIPVSLTDQSHGEYGEKNAENFWKYYWNTDDSWTLKDKSGIVYTFGSVSSSKEYDSSNSTRIYRWYLTEMRDANDNFIRFTYTKDSERIYPEFIYYTGHGSSDGPFIIEFHYQTRTDSAKNYRSGFLVQTKYRLNEILININGYNSSNNVRKYTLEYGTGDNGIRSILSSITEIGWDENGNSLTLSPTTFQYYNNSSTAIGWKKESASIPEPLGCNGDTKIIDVNNDAYDDIVRSYKYLDGGNKQQTTSRVYINGKNKTWMNQDSLWRFPEPFTFYTIGDDSLYIYNLLDFDGDFRIDLGEGMSFQNEQTYSVYYLTDTGWSAGPGYEDITGWTDYNSNVPDYGRRQIDVNGDGFTDLVLGYHNGFGSSGSCDPPGFMGEVRIHDVIQKKFAADTSYYNPFPFAYEEDSDCSGMFSYDPGFRIVDVNGDGLSDVVYSYFRLNNLLNLNDNERYTGVYLNNGKNGWVEDLGWSVPAPIRTSFNPSLQSDQCSKNYPFGSYAEYPGTYFMDVNGDGLNDMVFNTRAHINIEFLCPKDSFDTEMSRAIYLNNGINGWTKASNINDIPEFSNDYVAYDNRYSVSEVNGDGLLDVMYSSGNCEHGYPVDTSSLYLSQANPDTDLLKTIANPVGGTINISYASSANEKDSLGNYLNPNMQNAMRVVKKVTYNDALGTLQSTDYEYKDGKFYLYTNGLKEFGGFGKVTTKDGSTISATSFYQGNDAPYTIGSILNYSLKGKPYRTEVFDDFGRKYSESSQKWSVSDLGNGRYFPKLDAVVNFTYEGGASHRDTAVSYEYENARGNVIKETHYGEVSADPSTGNFTDLGSDGFLTTMMYTTSSDFMSFPIEFTTKDFEDNTKAQVRYYYDGSLTHGYANKGNVTKEDHWFNKDGSRIVTDFSYNFYGQVETVTNPRRYITTIEWDSNALYPIAMINAKNQRTSMTYNYGNGQIKTLTDANGSKEEYAYDPLGRLKTAKVSDPDNKNTLKTKTIYEYNDTNFPTSIAVKQYDGLTNSEPATYQYFDGFKRLIQSRTLLETSYSVKDVKYDEKGLLKEESVPYFDSGNSYKTPTWTTAKTAYVYDAFSRPLTVSFVKTNGTTYATTSYDYSTPWQTIITDPEGKIKRLRTDANQRLIEVDEVFNGITSTTRYKYHTLGFLTQITDALGNVRNFDYDSLGRTLSMQDMHAASDGDFGTWFFSYDSNGNVLTQTDANGILTNFTYDELDRPTYETDGSFSTIYGYDTSENGVGRLSYSIGSDTISTEYDYDTHGNVKKEYRIIEDKNFTTNYSSDIQGKPRSITNPDGFRTDYTYNGAGLLEQLTTSGSTGNKTIISNIDYAPTGQITSMVHGNGATTTNTFDPDDMYRLKSKYVNQGVLKLFAFDYGYDKASNITSLTDSSDTDTKKAVTYHYDDLHRLIFANGVYATGRGNYSHDFGYDILGNITYKTDVGTNGGNYRYDGTGNANPHAVTSVGGKSFTYDKNGNLLTDGDRTLTYNSKNLISRAVYNGATTDFRYDQGGNRVLKKTSDDTVWYPNQYYEIRKSGNIEKTYSYIFAGNQKVAANEGSTNFDADNDGWTESGGDCNDNDATVHPGASEICGDSVDQDCSGADLSCNDVDNDEDGYTENGGDCNDNDATVHPGASEVCGDSVDQDCSGADLSCSDADQDGDSYSVNEGDCNDNDSSVHPGATEIPYNGKDDDCLARQTPDDDLDQDDYPLAEDCDDTTDDIYPGALEICGDSIDQDCSGADEICAPDRDEDGIPDSTDNCPDTRSSNQTDSDGDGKGNICDNDTRLKYTFTPDADPLKIVDSTNYKNHGTIDSSRKPKINNLTDWAKGYAAYFDGGTDGSSDNIYLNDNDSLNTFEGLTVSAWIKPDTITGHHSMLSKWGKENANFEWDFYIQDGKLSLMLNAEDSECGGTETFAFVESRLIAAKKWTHVTATYDGSKIRFYVNGTVYSASSQSKMPIAELCDTAEKMRLGVSGYYDNDYIGYTDEVKISNYAKSNKEVCEQEMGYKWQIAASKCKPVDFDKDGYTVVQGDCDDLNPQKYPGNGCSAVNGGNLRGQNSTDESGDGRYGFEDKNFDFENRNVKSNDILSQQIVFAGTTSESSVNSPSLNFQPSKSESSMASQSSMTATTTYSLYYYFQDHLGDTAVVTDETGNIIEAMDYLPFGGVNIDQRYSSDYDADYTFTGKEKDAEEGLFYFGARYYNDVTGKFTSIDPALMEIGHLMNILADPQQFNSYSYVGNNPLAFIDANGKVPDPTDVVVVACGLAAPLCWGAKEAAETLIIVGGYYLIEKFLSDSTDTINDQSQEKENKKTLSDEEKEVIETEIKGLEKGIKSQEKRIKEHEEKLKDPEKALDDPVKKEEFKNNPQYREGVKEYWRKEIKDAQEQIIKNQNKINELESKLESN